MILDKLESIVNVRANEWRETGFFWGFTFLCWFAMAFGDSISDTLFIKRAGVENLPAMFMICSLFAIPVSILLTILHGRIEKRNLTIASGAVSALAIAAAVKFILSGDTTSTAGCYVLYFISNLLMFVMPVVLSVLMGTQFNALKAKRLLPIIFTGVIGGRIAAGLSLHWLAANHPVPQLLLVWLMIHCLAIIFFFFGSGSFIKPQIQNFFTRTPERKRVRLPEKFRNFVRSLLDSRLVLFLVLSAVCANLSYYFAEFQAASIFNSSFASENELAQFYGLFTIFASLFAFVFQGIITGSLIQRLGISNTNLIYPGLVLAGFAGTAASYTLIPGTGLKFIQVGLQNALYQPVNSLFYNALPPREKARIITVNEGILQPLGTVFTGLVLFFADKQGDLVRFLPLLACAFWVGVAILMRNPYRESLLKLLRSSNLDFFKKGDLQKLNLDQKTLDLLLNSLDTADEETAALVIQLIVTHGDRGSREQLTGRLGHFSDERKTEVLRQICLPIDHFSSEFLFKCLDSSSEDLKKEALKALTIFPTSARLRDRVLPFLASESEILRRFASIIFVKNGDLDQMIQSLGVIQNYLAGNTDSEVLKGIEMLGLSGDERFWVNLKPFLRNTDTRIRHAAALAFEKILHNGDSDEHYEIIGRLVKDDSREIRFLALKMLTRLSDAKWFYHVVEGLSDSSPRNRKLAEEILIAHYDDKFSELIMVLESSESSLHARAAVAGILAASQDSGVRDYLHHFGQRVILQLYEYKLEEFVINRELRRENSVYLKMLLKERAWALTRLIVCLIAPEQNREARDLFKSLYSSNEELVNNAIEVLQNMGERQLVYHIIPILENISLDQIAAYAMKVFSLREKDLRVILGKYLNSSDNELKEAAIYTVCIAEIPELMPVLKKIESDANLAASVAATCRWAIENLKNRGITLQFS
ncbi:MAG TPA: hypothetical protein PLM07_06450 [Candidatus Rifleibacterium sp.]|nr:hypothetical protein [Candidatus Rifleibacterium sp.]HPT45521.1 hypothetical protein [Candidatus Rifleibacterium sp.]